MNFEAALGEDQGLITEDVKLPYGEFIQNPLNLPAAKVDIERYRSEIEDVRERAEALVVQDQDSKSMAVAIGTTAKKLAKKIEEARKEKIGPASEYVSAVNNFAKIFIAPLKEIEDQLKRKINDHDRHMEIERQKREQAARRAAAELQAKLDAEAAEANRKAQEEAKKAGLKPETVETIVAPQVPEPIMPEAKPVTRTDSGSSYGRKEWTAEVENIDLVPVIYLVKACKTKNGQAALLSILKDEVKMGAREISGVKIWEKPTTVFKTN